MRFTPANTYCSYYRIQDLFTLKITYRKQATKIKMALFIPTVSTKDISSTIPVLESYLPSVLHSTCFNDEKLPFALEVRSTEIGHLFEHILLEYLCYFKLQNGFSNAEYSGVTRWDWGQDPYGVFHITINTGSEDAEIIAQAMQQSILLLQMILHEAKKTTLPYFIEQTVPLSPVFESLER